jgi:CheY-like chemotaxis protein
MRVLVVDDDVMNVERICSVANHLGMEAVGYSTLDAVYELADNGAISAPFICVLDHNFPGGPDGHRRNGYELATRLLEIYDWTSIRLIYISGVITEGDFMSLVHREHQDFTHYLDKGDAEFGDKFRELLLELDRQLEQVLRS